MNPTRAAAESEPWDERLVLVCGPPCTGKTALVQQHAAYQRCSFEGGTTVGQALKSKAKLVKIQLSKGCVCLDDQHEGSPYRKNMVSWSEAKQTLCVWCEPEGGRMQCIWANEWNMVAASEAGGSEYMPLAWTVERSTQAYGSKHKRSLENWFPSGSAVVPKPPSQEDLRAEGFHRVLPMPRLPLCPELHGTFHRVGLVIDAHAVLEDRSPSGGVEPIPGAAESVSQYVRTNPSARVVLLVQPTHLFRRQAMDPAENERELSTRAQALEQAALSGVRALAKQVAASGHSLHYLWLPPVSKPAAEAAETEAISLSAEHQAASARYLACAPAGGSPDGRLPSCPLAWAVRRHRLALGTLLYVRGTAAANAAPHPPGALHSDLHNALHSVFHSALHGALQCGVEPTIALLILSALRSGSSGASKQAVRRPATAGRRRVPQLPRFGCCRAGPAIAALPPPLCRAGRQRAYIVGCRASIAGEPLWPG